MGSRLAALTPDSIAWQDYRSSPTGMVVFYAGDAIAELPIREVPEEITSDISPDPNYETGTYGFYGCGKTKIRAAFAKEKIKYLLFVTKYVGTNADFQGKNFITGFYKITKTADVKRTHIRFGTDYSCLDEAACIALRADEVRFVAIEHAFPVTDAVLRSWNYKARLTQQTRVMIDEEKTQKIVDHLRAQPDSTAAYIAETTRLQPHAEEENEDEE